jgi:hypothetical protein
MTPGLASTLSPDLWAWPLSITAMGEHCVPIRTQVRGKGAIAVAAQAATENKLKVTANEIRPAKKR